MSYEDLGKPRSRVEGYYDNILGGDNDLGGPRSREEAYLAMIAEGGGGGGGGTSYSLSKAGGTITLAGSDGSESSVTDSLSHTLTITVGSQTVAFDGATDQTLNIQTADGVSY